MAKAQKPFYEVGVHHVKITSQRFYFHQSTKEKDEEGNPLKIPVFEINFDVIQKVDSLEGKVVEHSKKYNRPFRAFIKSTNFDISVDQINTLLKHCKINEPLDDFSKLDPDNPSYLNLVGKVVPMYCNHNDQGWEAWQPDSGGVGKKKQEEVKNETEAAQTLNNLFGSRLQNKAAVGQQESTPDTSYTEEVSNPPVSDDGPEEMPF